MSGGDYILRLNLNNNTIARVAGNGVLCPGSIDGPGGDPRDDLIEGGDAFKTYVGFPAELAVSPAGDVVFFDRNTCRIRRLDLAQGRLFAVAGNGMCGFSGDGFSAALASLSLRPDGVRRGRQSLPRRLQQRPRQTDRRAHERHRHGRRRRNVRHSRQRRVGALRRSACRRASRSIRRVTSSSQVGCTCSASRRVRDALVDGDAGEVISVIGGCNTNCMLPFNGDGLPVSHPQVYLPGMGH